MYTEDDKRTMVIIEEIANNIDENLKVTYDIPSNYEDLKVPILDVKAGLNEKNEIEYEFYKKPIANNLVTMKSSALSMNQKMTILTQQGFTVLHNTSEDIDDDVKLKHLNDFMQRLRISGYTESDRQNILNGTIKTYINLKQKEYTGIRPFYRSKSFNKKERTLLKSNKKKTWFRGKSNDSRYKSVMFVDATPGDTLLKMLRNTEERFKISSECRIKFVSKAGQKLVNLVKRKDPFAKNCTNNDCPPCENLSPEHKVLTRCKVDNVTYQGICKTCGDKGIQRIYDGETARNLHIRSKEHVNEYNRNYENSWMVKDVNKEHEGNKDSVEFTWKVLRKHMKPLERQVAEAVNISKKKDEENMNSKSEFNHQTVKRISLDKKKHMSFQCKICGIQSEQKEVLNSHMQMFHTKIQCVQCDYEAIGEKDLKYHAYVNHKLTHVDNTKIGSN